MEKTFPDCLLVTPKDATPPNYMKVFSLESFLLYGN